MLETLQKLVPWVSGLPTVPKVAVTAVWLLLSFTFLYLVWVPSAEIAPADSPAVQEAYGRMSRTLKRLNRSPSGQITVDGQPIEARLTEFYRNYVAIADFVAAHPNDIKGAYEEIWDYGGESRIFIDDTQAFEAVVRAFFMEYKTASQSKAGASAHSER